MYAEYFGLRELPFNNTPDPRFFYSTPDHEEALASLVYAVQERKGFVLLTGEVGTGKTLISRMMLRHFGTLIAFATINHALQGADDLLEAVCTEFELPIEDGGSHTRLVRRLHDFLLSRFAQDGQVVLVLDEAQTLPNQAFEQLRMIGNLEADDAKLLQIVIVGQPELQDRFASPELRQLRQRIFRSFHLPALSRSATEGYVRHRLSIAGGGGSEIFDAEAVDRIFEYAQGLPRLINTLCDNALLSAYSADRRRIDGNFLHSVIEQMMIADVSRNPSPPTRPPSPARPIARELHRIPAACADQPQPPRYHQPSKQEVALERLARNVAALEGRLTAIPTGGETPKRVMRENAPNAASVRNAPRHDENQKRDPKGIDEDVTLRLERLERRVNEQSGTAVGRRMTRPEHSPLPPPGPSPSMIARAEAVCQMLAQREARVRQLSSKMAAVLTEVRRIFDALKESNARTGRGEARAQQLHERLVEATERASAQWNRLEQTRLAPAGEGGIVAYAAAPVDTMGRVNPHGAPLVTGQRRPSSRSSPASVSMDSDGARLQQTERGLEPSTSWTERTSVAQAPTNLRNILASTRETLSDLRGLARRGAGDRGNPLVGKPPVAPNEKPHAPVASPHPPSSRLAQEVESLLTQIGAGSFASDAASSEVI